MIGPVITEENSKFDRDRDHQYLVLLHEVTHKMLCHLFFSPPFHAIAFSVIFRVFRFRA